MRAENKTLVLSLGGSLIFPGRIDTFFLKNFKKIVLKFVRKGYRFVIYAGGGRLARNFQDAAGKIAQLKPEDKDWLGIYATRLNALLLQRIFGQYAETQVMVDPTKHASFKKPVLIAAGWKPGWSTDYDAVLSAHALHIPLLINMTNVDYVYGKNLKKFKNAKPIKNMAWKELRKIVGSGWKPGLNMPFDPVAAKAAEKIKLKVVILGRSLANLSDFLAGKDFKGTTIS